MKMGHLRFALLVLVLSGMPAPAVLCDLVLCSPAPAADGCHEHRASTRTEHAVSSADTCSHLALVAPSLAAAQREGGTGSALVAVSVTPRYLERSSPPIGNALNANAPRRADAAARFLPLRI